MCHAADPCTIAQRRCGRVMSPVLKNSLVDYESAVVVTAPERCEVADEAAL